ncbi:carbohydrate sulfotransferase 10-like [Penaeus monodon]|uniref:carbohydrate sulfotransferase 10-like n=1 Tax=Penaeus monodon TaxID=6687 RepID=UPI0018A737B8|nr:carbohydrate sulfotransferase 10-like [Penaeus monodon]
MRDDATAMCRDAHPAARIPERSRFVWDRKHSPSIVFCPNYKVASTTWLSNFLKLAHYNEDNPAIPDNLPKAKREKMQLMAKYGAKHDVVFKLYPSPSSDLEKLKVMNESVRVTVVRHPFARLLSGYRDKMTKMRPSPVKFGFRKIQQEIIAKYRSHVTNNTSPFPTFEEFARYVIDSTGNLTTKKCKTTIINHSPPPPPHQINCWVPYWAQCSVCATDYTLIMKLETMAEDEQFLVVLSNLKELKGKKGKNWKHLNGQSSHDAAPQYYRELTKAQMKTLHERYKMDFDLFGYDIDDFLAIANWGKGQTPPFLLDTQNINFSIFHGVMYYPASASHSSNIQCSKPRVLSLFGRTCSSYGSPR